LRNFIFVVLLAIFSFANEDNTNTDSLENDFDSEFSQKKEEIFDPLSGYNRIMTSFNDKVFINVLNPVSEGYAYIIHENIRIGIDNFFENIMFPVRFSNNLLQLKFKNSGEELGRFAVNTTWGVLGFMDPATEKLDMKVHKEDFGQTLGFYGIGDGFHVVLPFLGPSNLRDIVGMSADSYVSALSTTGSSDLHYKIPNNYLEQAGIKTFDVINSNSLKLGQYESLKKDALNLYPFLRDIYTQARKKQIEE